MPATPDEKMNEIYTILETPRTKDTDPFFHLKAIPNRYNIPLKITIFLSTVIMLSFPYQFYLSDISGYRMDATLFFIMAALLVSSSVFLKLTTNIYITGAWSYLFYSQVQSFILYLNSNQTLSPVVCIIVNWLSIAFIVYIYYVSSKCRVIQTENHKETPTSLIEFSKLPQNFWLLFGIELMIMWAMQECTSILFFLDYAFNGYTLSLFPYGCKLIIMLKFVFIISTILIQVRCSIRLKNKLDTNSITALAIVAVLSSILTFLIHIQLIHKEGSEGAMILASDHFTHFVLCLLIPIISCNCLFVLRRRWKKYQPLYVTKDCKSTTQSGATN